LHITELEIENFKSFVKKVKIPFFNGFTVISGPNGSGKSNIIDSLLFVLALSGSRTLRAEKLTDLINLNSGKNAAEVSVTFSDGTKIRRRIKKTHAGYYSYNYLNERYCKQSEITEHLARNGIRPHGYNIVMQGDITRIIEMSDLERRRVIDEIAGVAEFDEKRDQALSELEIVRERIEREELLLSELESRKRELEVERDQALKYKQLQERLAVLESCKIAAELREKENEFSLLLKLKGEKEEELRVLIADKGIEENETEYLKGDLKELDSEISRKSGEEYLRIISSLEESKSEIKLCERTISSLKKEKEALFSEKNQVYLDIKRAEQRVNESSEQIRTLSIDRANLAMEVAALRAHREKIEKEISNLGKEDELRKNELFIALGEIESKKNERAVKIREQDIEIEKSRMRTSANERLEVSKYKIGEDVNERKSLISTIESSISALESEKESIIPKFHESEREVYKKKAELEDLRREYRQIDQKYHRIEAQQQIRGETFGRALEYVLGMDGVYGTISQLGKVPPEFGIALNIAAGGKLNHVVCTDDRVASEAIVSLKESRLGRVTFLPLNKMNPPPLTPILKPGAIDYAVNLIEFRNEFRDAFRVVFGQTVIFDTLANARLQIGQFRMVTLDGELLERSGAMTGGSIKKGISGFGVSVEDDLIKVRSELETFARNIQEKESSFTQIDLQVQNMRIRIAEIDQKLQGDKILLNDYLGHLASLEEEQRSIEEQLVSIITEGQNGAVNLVSLEKIINKFNKEIEEKARKISNIQKSLEETGIPELTERHENIRKEMDDAERRQRKKESDINDNQNERLHFQSRIKEMEREQKRIEDQITNIDIESERLIVQIKNHEQVIISLEERQQAFSKELSHLREKRGAIVQDIETHERHLIEIDSLKERILIQVSMLDERRDVLLTEISKLNEAAHGVETDLSITEIESEIVEVLSLIKRLGNVNMRAIEDFSRVVEKIGERANKKDILSRERAGIINRIDTFEKMKLEAFNSAFNAIDLNFRKIFARLTNGTGNLLLENKDDPFSGGLSFGVQPRDKKVHLLSSLSGGEKSLVTLAFIFAIQQHLPAPFYAFDEVDMSLDGTNVENIAQMIYELAGESQFIIVSLRKPMIEKALNIVGVTLKSDKSTLVTGVRSNA